MGYSPAKSFFFESPNLLIYLLLAILPPRAQFQQVWVCHQIFFHPPYRHLFFFFFIYIGPNYRPFLSPPFWSPGRMEVILLSCSFLSAEGVSLYEKLIALRLLSWATSNLTSIYSNQNHVPWGYKIIEFTNPPLPAWDMHMTTAWDKMYSTWKITNRNRYLRGRSPTIICQMVTTVYCKNSVSIHT